MRNLLMGPVLAVVALGAFGCSQAPDGVEKTQTTSTTAEGTVKTTSETKQVGTTLEAKTETKVDGKNGVVNSKTETFVGTVTVYTAGKKIEILTGEKNTHGFDLDAKGVLASVDDTVAVGSRVTLVDETGDTGIRRISVKVGG